MKIIEPADFALTSTNVADSQYPVWDASTSYSAGDNVYLTDNHGEYKALTNNSGKYPADNPADWQWLGTTNRWRMFDQYLNTVTENNGTIDFKITAYSTEAFYLANIEVTNLTIEVTNNKTGEIIESEDVNLMQDPIDWLDYFYGDWYIYNKGSFVYFRKTLVEDVTYHIIIDNKNDTAKAGIFVIGKLKDIGVSLTNANLSALDYSKVETDSNTGITFLQQGNYAKTLDLDVLTNTRGLDVVYRTLTGIRGKPMVFVADDRDSENLSSLAVFGYLKKFEAVLKTRRETLLTLNLQGLI